MLHKSFLGMLGALPHSESTPPLYYVNAWPWSRLFGIREFGLRSLSAVLGTATVAASCALGRTCISARAGLVAASLVACSPFLVWYSQEARSYALLAFLTALSAVAFARARRAPTRRALASWALIACLALLTHYFAVFVVAAEALRLVVVRYRLRAVWAAVAATAIVGGALLPLAIDQEGTGQTNWIAARSLTGRIRETLTQFVSGQYVPPHHLAMLAALAAAVILAVGLARMVEGTQRSGAMSVSALACFGIVAPLVVASTRFDKFFYRNLIGVWPLLAVGLAAVLAVDAARREPAVG